ncbi:hypothetical protein CKO51_10365 [Rhodopirellula sp. SM50]|nr:hypothetical protein CKO51_10365 [Rhodopirellula sp. SM50]
MARNPNGVQQGAAGANGDGIAPSCSTPLGLAVRGRLELGVRYRDPKLCCDTPVAWNRDAVGRIIGRP